MLTFSIARNFRRYPLGFCERYGNGTPESAGVWVKSPYRTRDRAYAFFAFPFSRLGISKINPLCHSACSRRSFSSCCSSSSSSSASKVGFLKWYLRMLNTRPLLTKSLSSSFIFALSDITSQLLTLMPTDSFDSMRTLRIAMYGMLIMGPSQHLWFNFVSKILPKSDVLTTLKKIFAGQAIYGPCMTSIFFSYNAVLRGESKDEIVGRLMRDLLPTLLNGLMYWPVCDFLMFKFVPVHLQPLVNSSFAYLWTIYLTYMASLKKVAA
ncbi:hypothetical protein Dimus_004552 [Dionaea muscipula]